MEQPDFSITVDITKIWHKKVEAFSEICNAFPNAKIFIVDIDMMT